MKLQDLMTINVLTISQDSPLKDAARLMIDAGVSGVPAVDGEDRLVGIITEADFVSTEAERRADKRAGLLRWILREGGIPTGERLVRDVMTRDIVSLPPTADHTEAARVMQREGVKRIPVVDDERLVGVISRKDILRAFVRPDEDIVEEIKETVMRQILWIDPNRAQVVCVDGNVSLHGQLETKSDATLLVEMVRRIDGVASLSQHLTYEIDNSKMEMVSPPSGYNRPNW